MHRTYIGTIVQHVCCAAMAKNVWAQPVGYTCGEAVLANNPPHALPREPATALIEKDSHLLVSARPHIGSELWSAGRAEPRLQSFGGESPDRNEPLLISLSGNAKKRR